jgi:benzodiazapine receptor
MNASILILFIPLFIGFFIGFFTKPDKWYFDLKKPLLNPPSYIFGIMWFILYIMIGISYYLALKDRSLVYWIIPLLHLIINFSYSPTIFIFKRLLESAFIVLLTLITLIIIMILFYSYKEYISVYLLIPYLLWLIFANYLAWSIYFINNIKND